MTSLFCPMCRTKLNMNDYIPRSKIEAKIKEIKNEPTTTRRQWEGQSRAVKELKDLLPK